MVNFNADQNKTIFFYESGTYASPSGEAQWAGKVQDFNPTADVVIETTRMQGTATRGVDEFDRTIEDYSCDISKYPQDWKSLYFALGLCTTTGTDPYTHTITQINNDDSNGVSAGTVLPSITLENSEANTDGTLIRTYNGAVLDSLSITSDGTGIISCDETWMAQNEIITSGAATSVTAQTTHAWVASIFSGEIGAVTVDELKGWNFTINNNLEGNHYSNGSRIVAGFDAGNVDFEYTPTFDATFVNAHDLYAKYKAGTEFNCILNGVYTTGSRTLAITMSGCIITSLDHPSSNEGKNEINPTIVPKTASVIAVDAIPIYKAF